MTPDKGAVLIVEDSPDDRDLLSRAFRKAQVEASLIFAADGVEAVEILEAAATGGGPDLAVVLLDLKLPRMSGFEVLARMKAHGTLRRLPVVILTSSRESVDLVQAYDLGANSYLVKPARPDALLRLVQQIDAYWLGLNEPAAPPR